MSVYAIDNSIFIHVHSQEYGILFIPRFWAKLLFDINPIGFVQNLRFEEDLAANLKSLLFNDETLKIINHLDIFQRLTMLIDKLRLIKELLDERSKCCFEVKYFILKNFYFTNIEGHRWALITLFKRSIHASIMTLWSFINFMHYEEHQVFKEASEKALNIFDTWNLETSDMNMFLLLKQEEIENKNHLVIVCDEEDNETTAWLAKFEDLIFS